MREREKGKNEIAFCLFVVICTVVNIEHSVRRSSVFTGPFSLHSSIAVLTRMVVCNQRTKMKRRESCCEAMREQ